jgi:molybdopterin-guanine dinucleotide biosynthesis protein A
MAPISVSGVVLAGGKSSRMGCDKGSLLVSGETLLFRQLRLLAEAGCDELLVSAADSPLKIPTPSPSVRVLSDKIPEAGPLAGIESALAAAGHDRVLVVAVDLPAMSTTLLRRLLALTTPGVGLVPVLAGRFEPLVAVYPREAHPEALARLSRGELALQPFVRAGLAAGWLREYAVPVVDEVCFTNWNRPEDLIAG